MPERSDAILYASRARFDLAEVGGHIRENPRSIGIYAHFAIQHADGTVFIQLGRRDLRRAQRQQRSDRADPRDVRCSGSSRFPVAMSEA